ncbi:phenylacetic acid degradation operon negative regulatory protein [Catenulispora sp. GAS73]
MPSEPAEPAEPVDRAQPVDGAQNATIAARRKAQPVSAPSKTEGTAAEAPAMKAPTPRSLIVSFFGAYGRELGGWIAVADLVTLLGRLGVDAPAVRSAVSRQKQRGFLQARQVGGVAGYSLSEQAQEILADGDRRIYLRQDVKLSDGWVLAVFSVPETERHRRHLLRSRLSRLGFGATAPGVWIAPSHLAEEARHTLERLELAEYVDLFRADYLAYGDLRESAARWWDLGAVQAGYAEFSEQFLATEKNAGAADDADAFATYLLALDAWRRMPYRDPGLPPELLPEDWRGTQAADIFFGLHDRLRGRGLSYVKSVVSR